MATEKSTKPENPKQPERSIPTGQASEKKQPNKERKKRILLQNEQKAKKEKEQQMFLAQTLGNLELSDSVAKIVEDIVKREPPTIQKSKGIALNLAENVTELSKRGDIDSQEALDVVLHLYTAYEGSMTSEDYNKYLTCLKGIPNVTSEIVASSLKRLGETTTISNTYGNDAVTDGKSLESINSLFDDDLRSVARGLYDEGKKSPLESKAPTSEPEVIIEASAEVDNEAINQQIEGDLDNAIRILENNLPPDENKADLYRRAIVTIAGYDGLSDARKIEKIREYKKKYQKAFTDRLESEARNFTNTGKSTESKLLLERAGATFKDNEIPLEATYVQSLLSNLENKNDPETVNISKFLRKQLIFLQEIGYVDALMFSDQSKTNINYLAEIRSRLQELYGNRELKTEEGQLIKHIKNRIVRLGGTGDEQFNIMYLSEPEKRELFTMGEYYVDQILKETEKVPLFGEELIVQAAKSRLQLLVQTINFYKGKLAAGERVDDLEKYMSIQNLTNEQKLEKRNEWKNLIDRLSKKITKRQEAINGRAAIEGLADFKTIEHCFITFGDEGLQFLLMENGGVVGKAVDIYMSVFKEQIYDKNGKTRRITRDVLNEILTIATTRLKDNKDLYLTDYQKGFKGVLRPEDIKLTDADCEGIMRLADIYTTLSARKAIAIENQAPIAKDPDVNTYDALGVWERLLSARRINTIYVDRWILLPDIEQVELHEAAVYACKVSGRDKQAKERLKGLKKYKPGTKDYSDEWLDIVKEIFGENKEGGVNLGEVKRYLNLERRRRIITQARKYNAFGLLDVEVTDYNALEVLDGNLLERALFINEGKKETDRLLFAYDIFSSGWRIDKYLKLVKMIWGDKDGVMALGLRLRRSGGYLLDARNPREIDEAINGGFKKDAFGRKVKDERGNYIREGGLKATLSQVASIRPHELLRFLYDGKDIKTQKWYIEIMRNPNSSTAQAINRILAKYKVDMNTNLDPYKFRGDVLYRHLQNKYLLVNHLLLSGGKVGEGAGWIDYKSLKIDDQRNWTLTERQVDVLNKVFKNNIQQIDDYLILMTQISRYVSNEVQIRELTTPKYRDIYYTAQWTDDFGNEYLDNGNYAPGRQVEKPVSGAYANKSLVELELQQAVREFDEANGVSVLLGSYGKDSSITRMWRDFGTAVEALTKLRGALSTDDKTWLESLYAIFEAVKAYSGEKPCAQKSMLMLAAGRLKTLKADTVFSIFNIAEGLPRTSAGRRLLNGKVQTITPNEMMRDVLDIAKRLDSSMEDGSPYWHDMFEQFLGLRWGFNSFLKDSRTGRISAKIPLYGERGKLVFVVSIFAIIALLAASTKSAVDEK